MGIPRQLHRVVGHDPGPESNGWWQRFAELHPHWTMCTWSDPLNPDDFELGRLFASCTSGAQLADLVRIEILWQHGGVYVDADVEPVSSFDPLCSLDFFIGTEDGRSVTNAVMGSTAGHAALRALMDRLLEHDALPQEFEPVEVTGPALFARQFDGRDDVVVLPREVFYPYNPYIGIDRDADWSERHSICVHHWAGSWKSKSDSTPSARTPLTVRTKVATVRNLRRLTTHLRDQSKSAASYGTFVGDNRVLISTTDGFPLLAFADDLSLTPQLVSEGWYDQGLLEFLDEVVRSGDWVVDIGANVGLFTVAAARRVGRWGRVVSFEADGELAALCRENVGLNSLRNVEVIAAAAGANPGTTSFSRHPRYRGSSVAGSEIHSGRSVKSGFEVTTIPVDSVDNALPPVAPIRVVKIDVEGGESVVLDGMTALLQDDRVDYIVLEVIRGNAANRWPALIERLEEFERSGAQLWLLGGRGARRRATLAEITLHENFPQVVVDFTA